MAVILMIEDSLLSRRTIAKILKNENYEILEAANGRQGIEMAMHYSPDCILLDLLMPDLDGRDVLQTLRQRGLEMPVIVVTADIQHSARRQCLELGAFTVIAKLPNPIELQTAVATALQLRSEEATWVLPSLS